MLIALMVIIIMNLLSIHLFHNYNCPNDYYDYVTNKCLTSCSSFITQKTEGNGNIRCYSSCIGEEFYQDTDNADKYICLDVCEHLVFIDTANSNKKKCVTNCDYSNYKKKIIIAFHKANAIFIIVIVIIV